MKCYEISPISDDIKENAEKIHSIACQIQCVNKRLEDHYVSPDDIGTLCNNIFGVIHYWTSYTYIGEKKEKCLKKAFQAFYSELYEMLVICQGSENDVVKTCADKILYQGKVYRYLGHSSWVDSENKIIPIYNDIFVSWSKEPENSYIESKLYGVMTWLSAEIRDPYYGIDLEGIEEAVLLLTNNECSLTRGKEREVVFPMIKECITEVKYIERNYEDDEEDDQT